MDNASDQTSGTAALAIYAQQLNVYAQQLDVNKEEAKKPLDTESPLVGRLKVCKIRLLAMMPVFDGKLVSPRDLTPNSIGFFERLLRQEILKTVLEIPEKDANKYLGAIDAVKHNLLEAKNALNLALDELEIVESGGTKREFYRCLDECAICLRTILNHWDVPQPPSKKRNQIAPS